MQELPPGQQPTQGFKIGDIYYVIFRHKWKLLAGFVAGVAAAAFIYLKTPPVYESEAKLLIKYVSDEAPPTDRSDPDARTTHWGPDSILNSELEIINNQSLGLAVASNLPPDILKRITHGTNTDYNAAGAYIRSHLTTEVPHLSTVIRLVFQDSDPQVVQPVLEQVVAAYHTIHSQIHGSGSFNEFVVAEADNRRDAWRRANEEYIQAKTNAGVIDIEESKKHYMTEMDRTAQQLVDTETELAGKEVFVRAMTGTTNIPSHYETLAPTNQSAIVKAQVVPPEVSAEYSDLRDTMNDQKQQLRHLLIEFQPDSPRVQGLRAQISTNEVRRFQLEKDYPSLASVKRNDPMTTTSSAVAAAPKFDLDEEMAQIQALQAKRIVLANYLAKVKADVGTLEQQETRITELAHKVDLAEKAMTDYVTRLDRVHTDERLGAGAASNINPFESPTPPYRAMAGQSKMIKKIGMAVLATFGGTIGLVLLLEFVVNQTVRRASDVEVRLGVPVFLSIPRLGINGNGRSLNDSRPALLLPEHATNGHGPNGNGAAAETPAKSNGKPQDLEMALWDPRHILHPFCEALRDRLINFFEVKNLTHKPKLVTVTGCEEGAGVSSIAAGLAASLSETGDGNVLLVDMNNQGTAQQFYRGDLACGLDEALEISEKRDSAMVQDNLYVVTGQSNNDKLPRALPKRFRHLVPRLRASDFDYIIFDMPPISQTSVTLQLARFMDTVLIVAESEKTDREVLRKATALLNESKTNVGVVLNKSRSYLPKRLQQEL